MFFSRKHLKHFFANDPVNIYDIQEKSHKFSVIYRLKTMARYMNFEVIEFFLNISAFHYDLRDKQRCIITGYVVKKDRRIQEYAHLP
jgi:hypothetical protein